jgi:phthiodiolone/phenolphthiodiolone dimycocerosates ketoreductase
MSITPAAWLLVITGRTHDDVDEALNSDIAKSFALNISAEFWDRHGVQHPSVRAFPGRRISFHRPWQRATVNSHARRVAVNTANVAYV